MATTWARVRSDESGLSLGTKVAGISLALRHARMAGRQGWSGVRIECRDEAERSAVEARFRRDTAPEGVEIQLCLAGAEDALPEGVERWVSLRGSAIYSRDALASGENEPDAAVELESRADIKRAKAFLFAQIRKSIQLDGLIAYYFQRPLARLLTRVLLNTRVSPNQVTLCALACGLIGATCAAMGGARNAMIAGILYSVSGIIDCVDGELARLRLQSSKIGEWLDSMTDETITFSLLAGLGIGLARDGYGDYWMAICLAGTALGALTLGRLYYDLHKQGLPIDTAQFPWFFDKPESEDPEEPSSPGALSMLFNGIGYLIRRDANVTITTVLLILNIRRVAAAGIAIAAFAVMLLAIVHYTVMASRRRAAS